jgi:triosephosphate isomerase
VRKPIIAGNWKMNTTLEAAQALVEGLAAGPATELVERVICPPFPWIVPLASQAMAAGLALGAQDCASEDEGAFTGEVSAKMLAPYCRYVIVGHSERRHILHEPDELVAAKFRAVLRNRLHPILCVGETLEERDAGQAGAVVSRQLGSALSGLPAATFETTEVVVAYEPVWAIGTGRSASPQDADQMSAHIRATVGEIVGVHAADRVRIQYGGSVSPENAASFLALADVDGLLVGGASLKADSFLRIIEAAQNVG